MGYRSEVCIAVKTAKVAEFELACPELLPWCDEIYDFSAGGSRDDVVVGRCYFLESIKWYDDSDGVKQWEAWHKAAEYEDYRFIRVGEDSSDHETCGDFEEANMYVSVSIDRPMPLMGHLAQAAAPAVTEE